MLFSYFKLFPLLLHNRLEKMVSKAIPSIQCRSFLRHFSSKNNDHYSTLGLPANATQDEIKNAFFELSKKHHPDAKKDESDEKIFRNIAAAYEILGSIKSRKIYDQGMKLDVTPQSKPVTTEVYEQEVKEEDKVDEAVVRFYKQRFDRFEIPKVKHAEESKKKEYDNRKTDERFKTFLKKKQEPVDAQEELKNMKLINRMYTVFISLVLMVSGYFSFKNGVLF